MILGHKEKEEILELVPDAFDDPSEYWKRVPQTKPGWDYSLSSERDILIRHSGMGDSGRRHRAAIVKMSYDCGVYNTSIKRIRPELSTYIHHIRRDTFPELSDLQTCLADSNTIIVPYEGIDWFGRHKTEVTILPVSVHDMKQVRQIYSKDYPREIWAYVPGTKCKYIISSYSRGVILERYSASGNLLRCQKWQLQSGINTNTKYYSCCITTADGVQHNTVAHQQLLKSFIPKPSDEYEVNHINGDTLYNVLDNLEWVTRQENSDHYNKSPEMAYKRTIGYKKISEWRRIHQKEIQSRPEVNAKRSQTLKNRYKNAHE